MYRGAIDVGPSFTSKESAWSSFSFTLKEIVIDGMRREMDSSVTEREGGGERLTRKPNPGEQKTLSPMDETFWKREVGGFEDPMSK